MKRFLHLGDLHIGKKLGDYPLKDDQENVLQQAVEIAETCDGVLIAGDVYDKSDPTPEAMAVFDRFLTSLCKLDKPVYIISGNHDSAGRISYLGELLQKNHVTVSAKFDGKLQTVSDPGDEIQIHLLPFVKPLDVRPFYKEEKIKTYEEAVRTVLAHSEIDKNKINILLCHQYITGGRKCDSEEHSVGGLDNIDVSAFDDFDYVALGHLHEPQCCVRETVRYCGSPLKYSLSEEKQKKTFTIVEISGKNQIQIVEIPVRLPHDVKTVKGSFAELRSMPYTEDFVNVILTDENADPDSRLILRSNFKNMLKFGIQNSTVSVEEEVSAVEHTESLSPADWFRQFYLSQKFCPPTEEHMKLVYQIFEELEEERRTS